MNIQRMIIDTILNGEPLYRASDERVMLTEYYLKHPQEFLIKDFTQNMQTEFRRLSIQGKIKRNTKVYQWDKTFEFLENTLDIQDIIGKTLDVRAVHKILRKREIYDLYSKSCKK